MLTVIVPVYNEERMVAQTVAEIAGHLRASFVGEQFEIIVVNDGSTDGTRAKLDAVNEPRMVVLHRPANRGYGAALKAGLRKARFEHIAITDADGTYPNREIPAMFRRCLDQELEMIVGARSGEDAHIPVLRKPAKAFLRRFASYLTNQEIPDLNSGLRIFRRELAMRYYDMYPDGFSFTTTITMAAISHDANVEFVPISYAKREGVSKIRPLRDTGNFLLLVIRMTMYFNPLRVFMPITCVLFSFFLALLAVDVFVFTDLTDRTFMAGTLVGLTFALGLIADAIAKRP